MFGHGGHTYIVSIWTLSPVVDMVQKRERLLDVTGYFGTVRWWCPTHACFVANSCLHHHHVVAATSTDLKQQRMLANWPEGLFLAGVIERVCAFVQECGRACV